MKDNLLRNAKSDLATAALIIENPRNREDLFGIACFHCQQAAEKSLKAVILFDGKQFPLIHDLVLLLGIVEEKHSDFAKFKVTVSGLNPYYTDTRYDLASSLDYSLEEAQEAYTGAESVYLAAGGLLS